MGIHVVRKAGKPVKWYVYAWRGGPQIHRQEGGPKPRITPELIVKADAARKEHYAPQRGTLARLVTEYRASAEWSRLVPHTKANCGPWLDRISDKFGAAPFAVLEDRRLKGDILRWRDGWASQPRTADMAIEVFRRVLSWGHERGMLTLNILAGVAKLYRVDRSDIVWTAEDFAKLKPHASKELWLAVRLASLTGLRLGDLTRLKWSDVGPHAIVVKTSKTKARANIPMLPELRGFLAEIPKKGDTVLVNSHGSPWTPSGLGSSFQKAKKRAGITVRLHDLRGTFATRCMIERMTDSEIAGILAWGEKDVAAIRAKYVNSTRVVVAMGERMAAKVVNSPVNQSTGSSGE
jgi:integrase